MTEGSRTGLVFLTVYQMLVSGLGLEVPRRTETICPVQVKMDENWLSKFLGVDRSELTRTKRSDR